MEVLEAKAEGTEVEMNHLSVHQELGYSDAFLLALELNWRPVSRKERLWSHQTLDGLFDDLGSFP